MYSRTYVTEGWSEVIKVSTAGLKVLPGIIECYVCFYVVHVFQCNDLKKRILQLLKRQHSKINIRKKCWAWCLLNVDTN